MEEREDQKDRLDFVRNQLNILTEDTKEKIKRVTEEVENKVSNGSVKKFPCFKCCLFCQAAPFGAHLSCEACLKCLVHCFLSVKKQGK